MQKWLFVAVLTIISCGAYSQSKPTSFYFYNTLRRIPAKSGGVYVLKTTLNNNDPIEIKRGQMATIQTDADSLGLVMSDKPHYMRFESGASYYYLISLPEEHSNFFVTKVSSQEFWFTVHDQKAFDNKEYFLRDCLKIVTEQK